MTPVTATTSSHPLRRPSNEGLARRNSRIQSRIDFRPLWSPTVFNARVGTFFFCGALTAFRYKGQWDYEHIADTRIFGSPPGGVSI